jgi:hypothetical protein
MLAVLRDEVARTDAMLVIADEMIPGLWGDRAGGDPGGDNGNDPGNDPGGDNGHLALTRRRNHVSYLMEAARIAVRAAMHAGDELDRHRGRA